MATTNTIATGLKRDHFLALAMRGFKKRVLPVLKLAYTANDVPLEGTDKIQVEYRPISSTVPTDYNGSYVFSGTTEVKAKDITINKRKYIPLSWTSSELRRQPALNPDKNRELEGEALGDAVLTDIFSCITAANFGASPVAAVAASAMDFDVLLDFKRICTEASMPKVGRMFALDSGHDSYLMRDSAVQMPNYGTPDAVRMGTVRELAGFAYEEVPLMPENGEKLVGFAAYQSAILVGFSPIQPTEDVQKALTAYQTYTDPDTGLTIEYRRWGNPDSDESREVLECNYGYAVGEAAALKRLCKP